MAGPVRTKEGRVHRKRMVAALADQSTLPPSSSGPGITIDRPDSSKSRKAPKPRNRWEAALAHVPEPVPPDFYVTDEHLNKKFLNEGHKEEDLPRLRAQFDETMDMFLDAGGGRIPVVGNKPAPGDKVHIISTDGSLDLRFFDAGLEDDRIYMFDFVDKDSRKPVNSPAGYQIIALHNPYHMLNVPGPIISWEKAMGVVAIEPGEERFSVPENCPCVLKRPGMPDFMFVVPERPRENYLPGFMRAVAAVAQ